MLGGAVERPDLNSLLLNVIPKTSAGADLVLDLRDLLMTRGHPGKCVRCFFGLLGQLDRPGALLPLRHWLEQNIEVEVRADGEIAETFPVNLEASDDIHGYCERTIRSMCEDRAYSARRLDLSFRYRATELVH